jgi:hypothetical protein
VIVPNPPYALAPTAFRFPALAQLAGRTPLGGQREVAIATYVAARLAHDALPERGLTDAIRAERVLGAKTWLANLALPAPVRPALIRLVEASAGGLGQTADALRGVIAVTANLLDTKAKSELDQLVAALSLHDPQR